MLRKVTVLVSVATIEKHDQPPGQVPAAEHEVGDATRPSADPGAESNDARHVDEKDRQIDCTNAH